MATDIRTDDGVLTGWATNCSACHAIINFKKVSALTRGQDDEATHPPDETAKCASCYRTATAAYVRTRTAQRNR